MGSLPLVLSAPHGGSEMPQHIDTIQHPDAIMLGDYGTKQLASLLSEKIYAKTKQRPSLVYTDLHRSKVDPNRPIPIGGGSGGGFGRMIYQDYHEKLKRAIEHTKLLQQQQSQMTTGSTTTNSNTDLQRVVLVVDLHGCKDSPGADSMPQLVQVGHLVSSKTLNSDEEVSEWVRGPHCLGTLLCQQGIPATPSLAYPHPPKPYFSGGYITQRYREENYIEENQDIAGVQTIQLEFPRCLRNKKERREVVADQVAQALIELLKHWNILIE